MTEIVALDYIVVISTLIVSLGIGVYHACWGPKQNNIQQYLLGDRKLNVFPVALSLSISFQSSVMILGNPAEIYVYGIPFIWQAVGYTVATLFALVSLVPLLHPLEITSFYEYFQRRFKSKITRVIATIMGILFNVFYMGIVLFGPGLAIETVTDFPLWASILAVASSAIVYTAAGGLRAVVWTDVFQMFIMLLGIFSVIIKTTVDVGGFKKVFDIARDGDRLIMPSFDPDPTVRNTFWSLVVGSSISLQYLLTTQTTVQRICSVPTVRDARKVIIVSTLATVMNYVLSCLLGLFVYAYFHKTRCDPIASKTIKNPNQILPLLVVTIFHDLPGLSGVFVAALLSASLSSISSVLSSLSAQTVEDIVKPMVKDLSESRATLIAKIAVFIYGFIGIAISFMIANIKGPLTQNLMGVFSGCVPATPTFYNNSSISSVLSSLSAQTVEDIVKPMVKDLSESRATLIAKIAVFIYGFIGIAISFMIANIKGPLTQITVSMLSSFGGACSGMFLFAAFCPWANYKGTIVGGITGMTLVLWISLGKSFSTTLAPPPRLPPAPVDKCLNTTHNREDMMTSSGSVHNVTDYPNNNTYITEHSHNHGLDVLYSISYFWMTPLTILVTFILGTIVSVLSGRPNPSEVDVKYLLPFFDYCFPCLPERLKNVLHCGADFGKSKMKLERAEIKIESEILAFATEELD